MLSRIIKGDGMRHSRFHDYQGVAVDLEGLTYLPRCLMSALALRLVSYRSKVPWLGYRAVGVIESLLDRKSSVLEYGSGMSTLWFARRVGRLVSIESDEKWHSHILEQLVAGRYENVSYLLCSEDQLAHLDNAVVQDNSFDFILVDGFNRDLVMAGAVRKVKPGGHIYLDNSDVPYVEHQTARRLLLDAAGSGAVVRIFRDFCPGQVGVTEGMLVQFPSK